MERETIRGNKALAKRLDVSECTVRSWRRKGILRQATLVDYGRVIIYDLEKVYECLHYSPVKVGRKRL